MSLVNLASQYYRTTISIFLFVIVSGSLVFNNIPKESSPDVSLPYIYVSLGLTGISPEDSEKLLIKPIEDEVSNIEGKKEMTSTSYQGGGNVLLEFDAGFDPDQALLDTREQVDRAKSDLPDDADEPKVSEVNISLFPILVVSISGDISEFLLKKISNDLKDKIQSIPNVLEVNIGGEREEQLDIVIDQNKIEAYGLNLNEILNFVRSNNQVVSAGNLDTGDGRCVNCDSFVRPATLVRICDECNYGSQQGRCVICGGVGVADAYYCKECTMMEKDRDGCPKIVNLGSAKTDLFYERKKYGFKR